MRRLALLMACALAVPAAYAQNSHAPPDPNEAGQLATRLLQLMESTAVAVPGLIRASEPLKQNADATFSALQRAPLNPSLTYQFINEIRAYLALSDSIPRPYPFPATADRQYAELREGLQRMQLHFEAILQAQDQAEQKHDSDPNSLKHYAEADTKLLPPTKLPRVVFLGHSITDAWRLNEYFTR